MNRLAREAEFKRTKKDDVLKQPGVAVKTFSAAHFSKGTRTGSMPSPRAPTARG